MAFLRIDHLVGWLLLTRVALCSPFPPSISSSAAASPSRIDARPPTVSVIGGSSVAHGTLPGQAVVLGSYLCGGTLISHNFILTAAHCFDHYTSADIPSIRIYLNTVDRKLFDSETEIRTIANHWIHPSYGTDPVSRFPINDIALIKLDTPVRNVAQVPLLRTATNLDGQPATVYGFGIAQSFDPAGDSPPSSLYMLQGALTILSKADCANYWGSSIQNSQYVCAIGAQDSCQGDSGGPLVASGTQVGVVSFGAPGCNPAKPVVYTSVAHYMDWIRTTIASS